MEGIYLLEASIIAKSRMLSLSYAIFRAKTFEGKEYSYYQSETPHPTIVYRNIRDYSPVLLLFSARSETTPMIWERCSLGRASISKSKSGIANGNGKFHQWMRDWDDRSA